MKKSIWKIEQGAIVSRIKEIPDSSSIRMNEEEKRKIAIGQEILEEPKWTTAMKQLADIGLIVLHDPLIGSIMKQIYENKKNNERLGIIEFKV